MSNVEVKMTWKGTLAYLLLGIENGNAEGKRIAKEELQRMAETADLATKMQTVLQIAEDALLHSEARANHYPEARKRHNEALEAVRSVLS